MSISGDLLSVEQEEKEWGNGIERSGEYPSTGGEEKISREDQERGRKAK